MDYMSNCVPMDEIAFHINLESWSNKGARDEIVVPKTRARTTMILECNIIII